MHPALLAAYATMLPRLQAEGALRAADAAMVPHMDAQARRRWYQDRQAIAQGGEARQVKRPTGPAQMQRDLAAIGIRVMR